MPGDQASKKFLTDATKAKDDLRAAEQAAAKKKAEDLQRQQDVANRQRLAFRECQQRRHFVARIDEDGIASVFAPQHEPVLEEGTNGVNLQ